MKRTSIYLKLQVIGAVNSEEGADGDKPHQEGRGAHLPMMRRAVPVSTHGARYRHGCRSTAREASTC